MRKIIHVDMDSFFASVEERDNPSIKGNPVAVGGSEHHRGVISAANYVARRFGVHSAMATARAKKLCPNLILLPTNMKKYKEVSASIREIFQQYTDLVEPLSLDEAFLDVSNCEQCYGSATWIAQDIRYKIFTTENLTASAGVSVNKFIAKVASDWDKPNGQYVVPPDDVDSFIAALPVEKIYGVGPKAAEKLHNLGVVTCQDLQTIAEGILVSNFGNKFGQQLFNLCRGIDEREVNPNRERKSLSVEETFLKDLTTFEQCKAEVVLLIQELKKRMSNQDNKEFNKVFIKIKFSDFSSTTVENCMNDLNMDKINNLLQEGFNRRDGKDVRLLGIGVRFKLHTEKEVQLDLFLS